MQNQSNLIIEKSKLYRQDSFGDKFSIPIDYVIYFEKEYDSHLNKYISENYDQLKFLFKGVGLNFIYPPLVTGKIEEVDKVLDYYLPQLAYNDVSGLSKTNYLAFALSQELGNIFKDNFNDEESDKNPYNYKDIIELLGYKGSLNSGFILFKPVDCVVGIPDYYNSKETVDVNLFFEEFITTVYHLNKPIEFSDFSISLESEETLFEYSNKSIEKFNISPEPLEYFSEILDEEAIEIIKGMEAYLSELKDSGQLLVLVPILKKLLDKEAQKLDLKSISRIEINAQNQISLPYFKKEVVLSHLTKSIYLLFLKHPQGIELKELGNYKKELVSIYSSVSNQLDYDKMVKSVDDVINLETKAIYTHLSRIKSAFYKIMDASYAKNYIVSGNGTEKRRVLFNTNAIDWK